MSTFDPQRITSAASLNRVQIADLPGLTVDSAVKGHTSYQLVSLAALARLVRQQADALSLDPSAQDHELHLALENCLASRHATVRATAERIARRIGRNLGYVLLTLKRGDAINRAARREWDDSYWRHWGTINRVWLGGGLVSGRLGSFIQQHALSVFEEAGISDYHIQISPYGSVLPLVGAARHAPPACQTALVFDFGSTLIKRARAVYQGDQLSELFCLPPRPTGWAKIDQPSDDPIHRATQRLERMVTVIAETWSTAQALPAGPALVSIAAYVRAGHPLPGQGGGYYQLRCLTDNVQTELGRRVCVQLDRTIDLLLLHDGTAAATAYAGMKDTVVIMVGTALGVGFPPSVERPRGISPNLAVIGPERYNNAL
jgi:hypothetical protein